MVDSKAKVVFTLLVGDIITDILKQINEADELSCNKILFGYPVDQSPGAPSPN